MQIGQGKDRILWKADNSGIFSAKSTFFLLVRPLAKLKKVKFFLWSLFYTSVNIAKRLQKDFPIWVLSPSCCSLCDRSEETLDHFFFFFLHCSFAHGAWSFIRSQFQLSMCLLFLENFGGSLLKGKANVLWNCTVRDLLWLLWRKKVFRWFFL